MSKSEIADASVLDVLQATIRERLSADPEHSYVARLHRKGLDAVLKKVGEEASEVLLAAKNEDSVNLVHELADLWFHCAVLMAHAGIEPEQLYSELARRAGTSGLAEKAARGQSSNGA